MITMQGNSQRKCVLSKVSRLSLAKGLNIVV